MRRIKRIPFFILSVVLIAVAAFMQADIVCTFNGEGADVIHEVVVEYKSSLRITAPEKELIKRVLYNKKMLKVAYNLHDVIVRPKLEKLTGYLAILTEDNYIYIFKVKAVKKGDKSKQFDQNIFIRR
jgi:hypothetical protein